MLWTLLVQLLIGAPLDYLAGLLQLRSPELGLISLAPSVPLSEEKKVFFSVEKKCVGCFGKRRQSVALIGCIFALCVYR